MVRRGAGVTVLIASMGLLLALTGQAVAAPVFDHEFGTFSDPRSITIGQGTGEVYVLDANAANVQKFDVDGTPVAFSALGTNVLDGAGAAEPDQTPQNGFDFSNAFVPGAGQVAIDESGGPNDGEIYVVSPGGSGVVDVFAPSGAYIGQLTGSGIPLAGEFRNPCGVAVDSDGTLFVADAIGGGSAVHRYEPSSGTVTESDWTGNLRAFDSQGSLCSVALDDAGHIFWAAAPAGPLTSYSLSQFSTNADALPEAGVLVDSNATAFAVDKATGGVFVDHGNGIAQYDESGLLLGAFATSDLFDSHGVGVRSSTGNVYATDSTTTTAKLFTAPPPALPSVDRQRAESVHATSIRLLAEVDPHGFATTYRFEYGGVDCSVGPCTSTAAKSAGLGFGGVTAAEEITGLQPDTLYRYRVVAENAQGIANGPDVSFRTYPASAAFGLPDGRGYERISPENTNGYPVAPARSRGVSASGDTVLFQVTRGAAPGTAAGVGGDVLRATRTTSGWTSRTLVPDVPVASTNFDSVPTIQAISEDLTASIVETPSELTTDSPPIGPVEPFTSFPKNLFLHDSEGGYRVVNPIYAGVSYRASTPDMSHVVFSSSRPQIDSPEIVDFQDYLYEWVEGDLRLLSVLPDGTAQSGVAVGGSDNSLGLQHPISSDGSRVFFHIKGATDGSYGQIYVREDGVSTAHVSASERAVPDPHGPLPALFLAAGAAHGDRALFTSCEQLTEDSTASSNLADPNGGDCQISPSGASQADKSDLYLYDVDSDELTDITTGDPSGADVAGFIGASDDLDRIYFTARGVLAPGAQAGQINIYLLDHGSTKFIGAGSLNGIGAKDSFAVQDSFNWSPGGAEHTIASRVSKSGRYLLLTLRAGLTLYDSSGPGCPLDESASAIGRQCSEVYRFDATDGGVACLSCPASNIASEGDSQLLSGVDFFTNGKGPLPDNLLENGTSYFETPNRLVAEDTNGAVDVYQVRAGSEPELISDGGDAGGARFADASPSGSDVFFTTSARLIPSDRDSQVDFYDARVGGGFASDSAARPCSGEACQGQISVQPEQSSPSSTLIGAGNVKAKAKKKKGHKKRHHHKSRHPKSRPHADGTRQKSETRRAGK